MKKKILIALVIIPVVLFIVVEIGLRLVAPAADFPVVERRFQNDLPGLEREVSWKTDEHGLRGEIAGDGPLVLFLGGENTAHFLQEDGNTWWGRAASDLEARGLDIRAVAGVGGGQAASWWLGWMRGPGAAVDPDVVVLSVGVGEVLSRPSGYVFREGVLQAVHPTGPTGLRGGLVRVSQIAAHMRLSRARKAAAAGSALGAEPDREAVALRDLAERRAEMPVVSEIPWTDDPGDELIATLRAFVSMAGDRGFEFVVAFEPWAHSMHEDLDEALSDRFRSMAVVEVEGRRLAVRHDPAWVDNRMRYLHMRVSATCDGLEIPLIDGAAEEPPASAFFDDFLFTDEGAAAYGRKVAGRLSELLAPR